MWRMVVVEDESLILEGILHTFDWKNMNVEIVGAFSSPLDALEHMIHDPPEILLTDIVMPERDGIWLIEQVKERRLPTDSLLLTNHTDFAYVHRALQLGALDYVVKIDMYESLPQAVERVVEHLREREKPVGEDLLDQAAQRLGRQIQSGCRVVAMPLTLRPSPGEEGFTVKDEGLWLGRFGEPRRKLGGPAGLSRWEDAHPRLSLERALKMYDLALLRDEGAVLCWEEDHTALSPKAGGWQGDLLALAHGTAVADTVPTLRRCLAGCIQARDLLIGEIKPVLLEVWGALSPYFSTEETRQLHSRGREVFGRAVSAMALCKWLEGHQPELREAMEINFRGQGGDIRDVLRYVDHLCCTELTLDAVAKYFYLNPSYLSTQFKKASGKSFTDYLRGRRMERAAQLCAGTNLSIHEVAQQVGYGDAKYFSRLFREEFGCLPSVYRSNLRG